MSLGDVRGIALGVLGMTLPDFYAMPVGVFWEALGAALGRSLGRG